MLRRELNGATKAVEQSVWNKTHPKTGHAMSGAVAVALELVNTVE
jgi:hypothetical protein